MVEDIVNGKYQPFDDFTIFPSLTKGKYVLLENKIKLNTQIRVRCSCSDFYWTFAYYNADAKALIGQRPANYTRKTNNPKLARNPGKHAGACKHVLLFLSMLMEGKVIKNAISVTNSYFNNKQRLNIVDKKDLTKMITQLNSELRRINKKV
jgi:hypothetical protein